MEEGVGFLPQQQGYRAEPLVLFGQSDHVLDVAQTTL